MASTTEPTATRPSTSEPPASELADGLVLRRAARSDLDAIVELSLRSHGEQEGPTLRDLIDRYGPDLWTVVTDGDRVVSTTMLLARQLVISSPGGPTISIPTGQPEYVATDPDHRRRGLIRAQIEWHHRRSEARGDLAQVIYGIPYFYRRLGYRYGLGVESFEIDPLLLRRPDGWTTGPLEPDELDEVRRLDRQVYERADLRLLPLDDDPPATVDLVPDGAVFPIGVRHDGRLRGWMRCIRYEKDEFCEVGEIATDSTEAAEVLLARAREVAGDLQLSVVARPGDPSATVLRSIGRPLRMFGGVYTRISDPRAFLEALRPMLSHRLASSPLAGERGELPLTLYHVTLVVPYADGAVGPIGTAPGVEDPGEDHAAVAPDALDALLLGRFGASGLEERHDDVNLGRHRALADILFPRLHADLAAGI